MNPHFDIHADDFGVSVHASQDIIALCRQGVLDSISIIPNMSCFDECVRMYKDAESSFPHPVSVSVHINLMEGHCTADPSLVPDLVDDRGFFRVSWLSLFRDSFISSRRSKLSGQIACEIEAQTDRVLTSGLSSCGIRYDSHQHPHHIPAVRDALRQCIEKRKKSGVMPSVTFIRNSREPVTAYFSAPRILFSYGIANCIKCFLLNSMSHEITRLQSDSGCRTTYLCGVLMSGHMDSRRLLLLHAGLLKFAEKHDTVIEILFHPGSVLEKEITDEYVKPGFVDFHLSPDRAVEYASARKIYEVFHE